MYSGTHPPDYLSEDKGYEYPFGTMEGVGGYMCIAADENVNTTCSDAVIDWFFTATSMFGVSEDAVMALRDSFRQNEVPNNVKVTRDNDVGDDSDAEDEYMVVAYMVDSGGKEVYPFDITFLTINGKQIRYFRCLNDAKRRKAFAALSGTIEDISSSLTEGEYKRLYDAAKGVFDA